MTLYRALAWDSVQEAYHYVYGLPSYGFETDKATEIGTARGDFIEINPNTWGRATGYKDCTGKEIFTGDIVELKAKGVNRRFTVIETTIDREYNTLDGFGGREKTAKVRLQGVIAFEWQQDGKTYTLLPCVDKKGGCDTEEMRIVGDIYTKPRREK